MSNFTSSALPPALKQILDDGWVGAHMASILYGGYCALVIQNVWYLWHNRRRGLVLLIYTLFTFAVTTIYYGISINGEQSSLIDDQGSDALETTSAASIVSDVTGVSGMWWSDGLLIWRCLIIWSDRRWVAILPSFLYILAVVVSVAFLVVTSLPGGSTSLLLGTRLFTAFYAISLAVNVMVTALIAGRLLYYRRLLRKEIGEENARCYTSVAAMVIESALIYMIFALLNTIFYALMHPLLIVFNPMLGLVQPLVPQLIIYRVSRGLSFTKDTARAFTSTSLVFATRTDDSRLRTERATLELMTRPSSNQSGTDRSQTTFMVMKAAEKA